MPNSSTLDSTNETKFIHEEHSTTLTKFGGRTYHVLYVGFSLVTIRLTREYNIEQEEVYIHFPKVPHFSSVLQKQKLGTQ